MVLNSVSSSLFINRDLSKVHTFTHSFIDVLKASKNVILGKCSKTVFDVTLIRCVLQVFKIYVIMLLLHITIYALLQPLNFIRHLFIPIFYEIFPLVKSITI